MACFTRSSRNSQGALISRCKRAGVRRGPRAIASFAACLLALLVFSPSATAQVRSHRLHHVWLFVMENHSLGQILGNRQAPFLNRMARRYRVATWVLSNGMLLREDRIRTIVREGLITTHGFSVDGYEAATVEAIRVNAKLETIPENVRMLLRVREEEDKREPRIIVRYALMRSNVEELPAAVERWGRLGIDKMDTGYLAVCNGIDHQESLYFHQDLMRDVFAEAAARGLTVIADGSGIARMQNPAPGTTLREGDRIRVQFAR